MSKEQASGQIGYLLDLLFLPKKLEKRYKVKNI